MPNESAPVAVKACVLPTTTVAVDGETVMLARAAALTVRLVVPVPVIPLTDEVAVIVFVPATVLEHVNVREPEAGAHVVLPVPVTELMLPATTLTVFPTQSVAVPEIVYVPLATPAVVVSDVGLIERANGDPLDSVSVAMLKVVGLVTAVPPNAPDCLAITPTVPVATPWIARTLIPVKVIVVAVVGVPEFDVNVSVNDVEVGVTV